MTIFNGKNTNKSSNVSFYTRLKYKKDAFSRLDDRLMEAIRDFNFSDYVLYGKINEKGLTVVPKEESLIGQVFNPAEDKVTFSNLIVANQLNDLMTFIRNRARVGQIPREGSFLSNLSPVSAFVDPFQEYFSYMGMIFKSFINKYVVKKKKHIKTFDDFLRMFLEYVGSTCPRYPVTFTGWYRSNHGSPFCSGIFVEMIKISKHDDSEKELMLNDSNFGFYVNACKQHGFLVSRNNPNVLVCDVNSPATRKYLNQASVLSSGDLFQKLYTETSSYDLRFLMNMLTNSYNDFLKINPFIRNFKFGKNNHMISDLFKREDFNNNININNYIKLYITIRNLEEHSYYSKNDLDNLIKDAKYLSKSLDSNSLMSYINTQLLPNSYTKNGSFTWYNNKIGG